MKDKNPYPFTPIWWLGDLDLRSCNPLSRALLVDLMCIMHESQRYGYIAVKGSDAAFESIKNFTGIEEVELRVNLTSLLHKKLIAWDKEKLLYYCPLMIERKRKMDRNRYQGSKGGNPLLVGGKAKEGESTDIYISKRKRKLRGVQLRAFNIFWQEFGYRKGKADTVDAWLDLKVDGDLYELIIKGAKRENFGRRITLERGGIPIMAQGWLSGKRWEDGT